MKRFLAMLLAVVMVFQLGPTVTLAAGIENSSIIKKLEDIFNIDITKYFDGDTLYQLPSTVKDDDEISVIISLDVINIMDAYGAG